MKRYGARLGLAIAYGAAVLSTHAGFPGLASALGAGLVTATTALGREVRWTTAAVAAALASLAGAAVFAAARFILAPAYVSVREAIESPIVPLGITFLFSLLARFDVRPSAPRPGLAVDPADGLGAVDGDRPVR